MRRGWAESFLVFVGDNVSLKSAEARVSECVATCRISICRNELELDSV